MSATVTKNKSQENNFKFEDYDAYGFDLDHTIAKFKIVELFKLVYHSLADYLVNVKGYSAELKKELHLDKDFCTKGLFMDAIRGNFLKLSDKGIIIRGSHGTKYLSTDELKVIYGESLLFEHYEHVKKTVQNDSDKYRFFENYFDCPGAVVCAHLIDIADKEAGDGTVTYTFWKDVIAAYTNLYHPKQFSAHSGGFFPHFKLDPDKYLQKCSERVKKWIKDLKRKNKVVFLVTTSYNDFARFTMHYVLGTDWLSYFDICITNAKKPSFFTEGRPFLNLYGDKECSATTDLQANNCYSQGNVEGLNKFIASLTGKENPKVVYFGDNLRSDCFPLHVHAGWDAVLIQEEMDAESYLPKEMLEAENDPHINKKRRHLEFTVLLDEEEKEWILSKRWNSFFHDPLAAAVKGDTSNLQMNTFWGYIISQYCDIAVPSLEYLADLPLDHTFIRFGENPGNTHGFHPGVPSSLLK